MLAQRWALAVSCNACRRNPSRFLIYLTINNIINELGGLKYVVKLLGKKKKNKEDITGLSAL